MENKINIAELLKDCPQGMELDCTMYDNCTYAGIEDVGYIDILINTPSGRIRLTKEGCYIHHDDNAKCVIFPKGKTTWEGFHRPFVEGDIVSTKDGTYIGIVKYTEDNHSCDTFCLIDDVEDFFINTNFYFSRFATEEEKQKLFQAIKDNGYRWNPETKTLEKLIEPKFKVGDVIKHKEKTRWVCTIARVGDRYYVDGHPMCFTLPFGKQNDYELVPNKFDINTLKPFDKVLVRDKDTDTWEAHLFSRYYKNSDRPYICIGVEGINEFNQCIPYDSNKELLGTTDNCDKFYKTWE